MKKIIFFDIDGTLFDVSNFLNGLLIKIQTENGKEINQTAFNEIYESSKKEKGYFVPSVFIDFISSKFSIIKEKAWEIFWEVDLFEKSLYKDSLAIGDLVNLAQIGIFSKGDLNFQKKKLSFLPIAIDNKLIFVFPDKVSKIREVFGKYKNYKVYLVDDNSEVLSKVRNLSKANVILIDRNNRYNDINVKKIRSLSELKRIL